MASTASDSLALELMSDGENTNLWGSVTNRNLQALESAVSGYVSVAVAGATTTLTRTAYTLGDWQNMGLKFTGTLTTNSSVIVPTYDKMYFVENATTGSFTLTVKTTAGTGIVVPTGQKALLMCDGTNVVGIVLQAYDSTSYAPLASPTFTGTPAAPTASAATNTTQLATTAYVTTAVAAVAGGAPLASPAFTGTPTAPTAAAATSTTQLATTAFVTTADNLKANLASPTFTGTPAAPTATAGTSTTQLATTAFVTASPTFTGVPVAPTAAAATNTTQLATTAFVTTADALKANLASPTFTGTPAAPTAAAATNTTQIATTAFVTTADALKADLASPTFTGTPAAPTAAAATSTTQIATTAFVNTNYAALAAVNVFTKAVRGTISALTDAATIAVDASLGNYFSVTLGGNRTLGNPSNLVAGQGGSIIITQDGTGSRTLAYSSNWKFAGGTAPTLTTTAAAVDRLDYLVVSSSIIHAALTKDVK